MVPRKSIVAMLIMVLLAGFLWAEDARAGSGAGTVFERYPSALGGNINFPVTGGLTYQHWFGRAGVEITAGAIADPTGYFDYNIQGAFQYMLYGEDFADWFSGCLYTNVLLGHRGNGSTAVEAPTYIATEYLGLGVGIEMVFLRHLSSSLEFMYVGSWPMALNFGFGGSLKYRF